MQKHINYDTTGTLKNRFLNIENKVYIKILAPLLFASFKKKSTSMCL